MSFGGGGGGGTSTTVNRVEPYAPSTGALNQIISEAGTIYGQGPAGTGYVAPSTQTIQGLAAQETMAKAANQQLMDTIQGKFSNPFLSPLIAQAGKDIYTNVAAEFSGAGRTPTSMGAQSAVIGQVADRALPLAFAQLERERNRQLQTARAVPSLTAVGGALEDIQAEKQLAPFAALQQYQQTVSPIAFGLPQTIGTQTQPRPNPVGMAAGGALTGAALGSQIGAVGGPMGAAIGAGFGLLGGLL
tara:strand:+ start:3666 stop:4400 length:735 start_codon:yes stop_codon:yes gene_type:complete